MRTSSNAILRGNMDTHQPNKKLAAAQTKMGRNTLNIAYRNRKTNIWVLEKTKVTKVIEQVRRRKWTWAGHVSRIRDNRWPSRITNCNRTIQKDLQEDATNHGTLWMHNDGDELLHYLLYYWKCKYPSPSVCKTKVAIEIITFLSYGNSVYIYGKDNV